MEGVAGLDQRPQQGRPDSQCGCSAAGEELEGKLRHTPVCACNGSGLVPPTAGRQEEKAARLMPTRCPRTPLCVYWQLGLCCSSARSSQRTSQESTLTVPFSVQSSSSSGAGKGREGADFFLHFVLKNRDVPVTPFSSLEASQAVSNKDTGRVPQRHSLGSKPSSQGFSSGCALWFLADRSWAACADPGKPAGISLPLQDTGFMTITKASNTHTLAV